VTFVRYFGKKSSKIARHWRSIQERSMRVNFYVQIVVVFASLLLESCGSIALTPTQVSLPTLPPPIATNTSLSTLTPTSVPPTFTPEPTVIPSPTIALPTLPPADGIVTFTGGTKCDYEGPESFPAVNDFTINLYIHSTTSFYYMFLVTILEEGRTTEELIKEIKNPLPPPTWSTGAGDYEIPSGTSSQIILNFADKPFYGPVYFICMSGSRDKHELLEVLGPFEVQ